MIQVRDIYFLLQQSIVGATPLVLAGTGELLAERSGVINIGIEGMMLSGCFATYVVAASCGSGLLSLSTAVADGMAAGMVLAALFSFGTIWLRGDQIVSGTALNLLAAGITTTAWGAVSSNLSLIEKSADTQPHIPPYVMIIIALALALATWMMLGYTRAGLIIRALGDAPDACNAAGIRVRWWRTLCVLFGGACAGLAGAYLVLSRVFEFSPDRTGGRGFLVLALVIFGRWNVLGLIGGCLLFGITDDLQQSLHDYAFAQQLPPDLLKMLPYVATLVALAILTRSRGAPAALGRPWPEEL